MTEGPGSGVRVLNNPVPQAFKESIETTMGASTLDNGRPKIRPLHRQSR